MKKKYLFFFLIIFLIIFLFFFYKTKTFSKDLLKLEIHGPVLVEAGQEVQYLVKYKNTSNVLLERPKIYFECPPFSLKCEFLGSQIYQKEGQRIEIYLDPISPQKEETLRFLVSFLGKEQEKKELKTKLSFKPKGLFVEYFQEANFELNIQKNPIDFYFDFKETPQAQKPFEFSLNYYSGFDFNLSGLEITVFYPEEFTFLESDPRAVFENNIWSQDVLESKKNQQIKIKGVFKDQLSEEKEFSAKMEILNEVGERLVLKEVKKIIKIFPPSIDIRQKINDSEENSLVFSDVFNYEIIFKNQTDTPLKNLYLKVELEGDIFDFSTLYSPFGQEDKNAGSLFWDEDSVSFLKELEPAQEGIVVFWIRPKKNFSVPPQGVNIKSKIEISGVLKEFETKIYPPQ